MIWRPASGGMWDPSVFWHDGRYHIFSMYHEEGNLVHGYCFLATSTDGVHWTDQGIVLEERDRKKGNYFFKCALARCGDRFIMNHGVWRPDPQQPGKYIQDPLRFYESPDLVHWQYLCDSNPDTRWYARPGRWDHMFMLPKDPGDPKAGYWGHVVAWAKPDLPRGVGMMQSRDGRAWEALPPAEVQWGAIAPRDLEWGGCERIGGKAYLIGGGYLPGTYCMQSFVADHPRGPFRPDAEAYRLCGTSKHKITWLACWARGERGELLISNTASATPGERDFPWMLPLRKPVVDAAGHLRLGWWRGNESLKGRPLPLKETSVPLESTTAGDGYAFYRPGLPFETSRGMVLEGTITARAAGAGPAAGFMLEEEEGCDVAILLGIGPGGKRKTHIGRVTPTGGAFTFSSEDVTGQGCATVTGLDDGSPHRFRLLVRNTYFELYVDNLLVQTFVYRPERGRFGFVVRHAQAMFGGMRGWHMSLGDGH